MAVPLEKREAGVEKPLPGKASSEAQLVKFLDDGKYTDAEQAALGAEFPEDGWERLGTRADTEIRSLSPEELPKDPLTTDQAKFGMDSASNNRIIEFGNEHKPSMKEILEAKELLEENDTIIEELLKLIKEAKRQIIRSMTAKPVSILALPIIADIYGIIKGGRVKVLLSKMEKLLGKFSDPAKINEKLKSDNISPNAGHIINLVGSSVYVGGVITAATVSGPIGLPIAIAGGLTALVGSVKQIIDYADVNKSRKAVGELETKVLKMQTENIVARKTLETYTQAYTLGARENIQKLMN